MGDSINEAVKKALDGTAFFSEASDEGREKMHRTLVSANKKLEFFTVGSSICKRELICYKIGNGRRRVAFFGAHHALESITANILYAFIYILNSPTVASLTGGCSLSHLLSLYTVCVLPCVNPDGIELRLTGECRSPLKSRVIEMSGGDFSLWQANERGVDLNHNYDYGFSDYKVIEGEREICAGPTLYSGEYPESEPESRAVANFIRVTMPSAIVSLHSQGEEIFFSPPSCLNICRRLCDCCGYTPATPVGTAVYGGLCDYTGMVLKIPSFTFEVGKGKNPLPLNLLPDLVARVTPAFFRLLTCL